MFGYSNLGSATAGVTPAPFLSVVAYKGSLETSLCFPKQWKCKLRMSALYPKIRFWNHLAFHSGSVTTWRLAVVSHDERQAEFPSSYSDLSTNECFIPKLHNICVICSAFQLQRAWKNINATSQKASVLTAALLMGKWRRAWVWLGAAGARCARTGSGWQQGRGQPLEPARNCWAIPWNAWTCHISDLFEFIRKFPFQILFFFRIVGSWACREGHFSFLLSCFLNYWVKKLQCKTYVFLLGGGGGGGMLSRICKLNWKKKKKKKTLNVLVLRDRDGAKGLTGGTGWAHGTGGPPVPPQCCRRPQQSPARTLQRAQPPQHPPSAMPRVYISSSMHKQRCAFVVFSGLTFQGVLVCLFFFAATKDFLLKCSFIYTYAVSKVRYS